MAEIDLLDAYPRSGHQLEVRSAATDADRRIAREFGQEYFDGPRESGYGGYKYDPRFWTDTVKRIRDHFGLAEDASILDVGCAKGLMLHDFQILMPQARLAGIDISEYAIANAIDDMKPFLQIASAAELPYEDNSFDLVISISSIHNLPRSECFRAIKEISRVSNGDCYITVGAYGNAEEKRRQEIWGLTQLTSLSKQEWVRFFAEAEYTGDYYWFTPHPA